MSILSAFQKVSEDEHVWAYAEALDVAVREGDQTGLESGSMARVAIAAFYHGIARSDISADAAERVRPEYGAYLKSDEWAATREFMLWLVGYRCQGCDTDRNLEVHHRTYANLGHEMPEDLTVLCSGCHTAVHLVADGRRGKIRTESRRARV